MKNTWARIPRIADPGIMAFMVKFLLRQTRVRTSRDTILSVWNQRKFAEVEIRRRQKIW
jgi:hypothetical protein